MPDFPITTGVPPPRAGKGRRGSKYPLASMKAGTSIFVPAHEAKPQAVRCAVSYFSRHHRGYVFTTEQRTEADLGPGTRVWRVK